MFKNSAKFGHDKDVLNFIKPKKNENENLTDSDNTVSVI